MSLATDRATIATALSTVDGVNGYAVKPSALAPGDAWPRVAALEEPIPGAGPCQVRWAALVVLAADQDTALDQFEALAAALWDALQPVGYVQTIEPVTFTAPGPVNHNAIQVTFIRELS